MIWLIGVGNMGKEYAKVLTSLTCDYIAIGRSERTAVDFQNVTGHSVVRGGLTAFLRTKPQIPEAVIVAVNIEQLSATSVELAHYGVRKILIEKPGIGNLDEVNLLVDSVHKMGTTILLAYNRRFYSSVLKAEQIIKEDGGVSSFNFEFTEWTHTINPINYSMIACEHWLLGNSSHVIDTAFFLGGQPSEIACFKAGVNALTWHPTATIFSGAGVSEEGALFSYQANWKAPGRWVIEILTEKHRLYFKPMESLQIQNIGSVAVNPVEIDNRLDTEFKPGFYLQTKAFLDGDYSRFCTIEDQKEHIDKYYKLMSGYK